MAVVAAPMPAALPCLGDGEVYTWRAMAMETAFRSDERFTQAQFVDWLHARPRHDSNRYQLLDGHIVMTPPAGYVHGSIEAQLCAALVLHVNAGDLGEVYASSAGYELPSGDTVAPDVSFVSKARLQHLPAPEEGRFHRIVPDLVVEILSASTARRDRVAKRRIYERNGIAEYWIVSSKPRQVLVFHLRDSSYGDAITINEGLLESSVLPGFSVPLSSIFPRR